MDGAGPGADYQTITVTPYSPAIGAEIGNIDLTRTLSDLELAEIRRAFADHMVLFFRDQEISFDDHARFGEYFGTLGQHVGKQTNSQSTNDLRVRKFHADGDTPRVSGNVWHTDQSCAPIPPLASVLSAFGTLVTPVRFDLARGTAGGIDWNACACKMSASRATVSVLGSDPTACATHPAGDFPGNHVRWTRTPSLTSARGVSDMECDVITSTR